MTSTYRIYSVDANGAIVNYIDTVYKSETPEKALKAGYMAMPRLYEPSEHRYFVVPGEGGDGILGILGSLAGAKFLSIQTVAVVPA
jgi:hypothetical protein